MATEALIQRYRNCYGKLLRLYPGPYRERFGPSMEQTFTDLCREQVKAERGLVSFGLWMLLETSAAIVRENSKVLMQKSMVRIAIGSGLILMIPLVLTLLGEWKWDKPGVYVLAFALLFSCGLAFELVSRKVPNSTYRFAVGLAVGTACILSWVNLVRVVESENPANLLYYGVLLIGVIGAVIARFQPRGMARALFAMALAQVLVSTILLLFWEIRPAPGSAIGLTGNAIFSALFITSALLFQRANTNHS